MRGSKPSCSAGFDFREQVEIKESGAKSHVAAARNQDHESGIWSRNAGGGTFVGMLSYCSLIHFLNTSHEALTTKHKQRTTKN